MYPFSRSLMDPEIGRSIRTVGKMLIFDENG